MLAWSLRTLLGAARAFEGLWMFLCKNGKQLVSHSLSNHGSMGCVSDSCCIAGGRLHRKGALTIFKQISRVASVDG